MSHKILDVRDMSWTDAMLDFGEGCKRLETLIENQLECALKNIDNVEEGIRGLWSFHNYISRENLKALFHRKTTIVS